MYVSVHYRVSTKKYQILPILYLYLGYTTLIEGTYFKLTYNSRIKNNVTRYIRIKVLGDGEVPKNLWRIYVKIVIHGVQYEAELEAEPGMDFFIYGWNC